MMALTLPLPSVSLRACLFLCPRIHCRIHCRTHCRIHPFHQCCIPHPFHHCCIHSFHCHPHPSRQSHHDYPSHNLLLSLHTAAWVLGSLTCFGPAKTTAWSLETPCLASSLAQQNSSPSRRPSRCPFRSSVAAKTAQLPSKMCRGCQQRKWRCLCCPCGLCVQCGARSSHCLAAVRS